MATAAQLIAAAQSEIGYSEYPPNSNQNKFAAEAGHANGYAWCASFVVAMARRVGLKLPSESAYTPTMANGFQRIGKWAGTPSIGAIAFFDFPDSTTRIQHVGIVTGLGSGHITTIEGNTASGNGGSQDNGGGVWPKRRPTAHVVGYGLPDFTDQLPTTEDDEDMAATFVVYRDDTDGQLFQLTGEAAVLLPNGQAQVDEWRGAYGNDKVAILDASHDDLESLLARKRRDRGTI